MIHIVKSQEPECLKKIRETKGSEYNSLKGDCLRMTREFLSNDQNGLCAYCQRYLKSTFIEHYIPQSKDSSKELEYSNFLGVCSGKYYIDKKTGNHIEFCSCSKGNRDIAVNPLEKESISTIFYDGQNQIRSTNKQIDIDLNGTLNLNFSEICDDRRDSYSHFLKSIFEIGRKMKLSNFEIYIKALKSLNSQKKEFNGFITYRLTKAIEYKKRK